MACWNRGTVAETNFCSYVVARNRWRFSVKTLLIQLEKTRNEKVPKQIFGKQKSKKVAKKVPVKNPQEQYSEKKSFDVKLEILFVGRVSKNSSAECPSFLKTVLTVNNKLFVSVKHDQTCIREMKKFHFSQEIERIKWWKSGFWTSIKVRWCRHGIRKMCDRIKLYVILLIYTIHVQLLQTDRQIIIFQIRFLSTA